MAEQSATRLKASGRVPRSWERGKGREGRQTGQAVYSV